jgi:menaquinone-dependent protoporphyrinogen oxidase
MTDERARVLLAYHTAEGQTEKVAERIAATLRAAGADVEVARAEDRPGPAGFDLVIAGDSVHAGRHSRALSRWLARHADDLDGVPLALFQVSLTSASAEEDRAAEAHRLLQRLLDATGVDPDVVGLFAGALAYTRYGWLKRKVMTTIASKDGGDTDTSRDHEYTDWDAVEHFATDALALVTDRSAAPEAG